MKSEIIQNACKDMWEKAAFLCTDVPELTDKYNVYIERIQSLTEKKADEGEDKETAVQDYNTLVKKQDNEAVVVTAGDNA